MRANDEVPDAFTSSGDYGNEDLWNVLGEMRLRDHVGFASDLWPRWIVELITPRHTYDIIHAKEKISIGAILFAWFLHIVFWYLTAVYLDNVNPGKFGSAKPWYYLCTVNMIKARDQLRIWRWSCCPNFVRLIIRFSRNRVVMRMKWDIGDRLIGRQWNMSRRI